MNIENIQAMIKAHEQAMKLMRTSEPRLSLTQLVFKKYIEIEHTTKVAAYLRENKRKLPDGKSIQPAHISEMLQSIPDDVPEGVVNIAQSILKNNQKISRHISG